jgi:hypothetical protein
MRDGSVRFGSTWRSEKPILPPKCCRPGGGYLAIRRPVFKFCILKDQLKYYVLNENILHYIPSTLGFWRIRRNFESLKRMCALDSLTTS